MYYHLQTPTSILTPAQKFAQAKGIPVSQTITNLQIDRIIKQAPKVKPKAGPAQITLRNNLIKNIAANARARAKTTIRGNKAGFLTQIQADQRKLAQLLVTYQF